MNPQTETQNKNSQKPDFDFIMNQHDGVQKPKRNVKVIVLVVLLILTVVIFIVSSFVSPQPEVNTSAASGVSIQDGATHETVVDDFMETMGTSKDVASATVYLGGNLANPSLPNTFMLDRLRSNLDFGDCTKESETTISENEIEHAYYCKNKDQLSDLFIVNTKQENDTIFVSAFRIENDA